MANIEIGIFDMDGTIRSKGIIPSQIEQGFEALHQNGILTTCITGRGYSRLVEILGPQGLTILSPNVPIGIENAGRIVDQLGQKNLKYYPLTIEEIASTIETLSAETVEFAAYFRQNSQEKAVLWTPHSAQLDTLAASMGHFAEINNCSLEKFARRMKQDRPCMLNVKTRTADFRDEFPRGINLVYNEGVININTQGINKGTGVQDISDILNIQLKSVLIVGNDENDLPMYRMPVGKKIFVGSLYEDQIAKVSDVIRVEDPVALGNYLTTI